MHVEMLYLFHNPVNYFTSSAFLSPYFFNIFLFFFSTWCKHSFTPIKFNINAANCYKPLKSAMFFPHLDLFKILHALYFSHCSMFPHISVISKYTVILPSPI